MLGAASSIFRKSTTLARDMAFFFLLLSSLQVVCGDDGGDDGGDAPRDARQNRCAPDQYVDPISPQYCKSCVELCDVRREPSLESCKFRCPNYYQQMNEMVSAITTQEPDGDKNVFDPRLYIGIGLGLVALVIIGSVAGYFIRRHRHSRAREEDVEEGVDQEEPLKYPVEVSLDEREPQEEDGD